MLVLAAARKETGWKLYVRVGASTNAPYAAMVANYGNQDPGKLYASGVNLMRPPEGNPELCHYPQEALALQESLNNNYSSNIFDEREFAEDNDSYNNHTNSSSNTTSTSMTNATAHTIVNYATITEAYDEEFGFIPRDNTNVALFVSYGDQCLQSVKAQVAAQLQQNFTKYGRVTHLIIHNNNLGNLDGLHTLADSLDNKDLIQNISVIFVSTRTGQDIYGIFKAEAKHHRYANPQFMADGNELWNLPVVFFRDTDNQYNGGGMGMGDGTSSGGGPGMYGGNTGSSGGSSTAAGGSYQGSDTYSGYTFPPQPQMTNRNQQEDNFYWFRLIVFSMLVVSPCFRAVYLWYAGGARIRFRYNENGRIVGLTYIPPMPYWFSPRPDDSYPETPSQMTQEEVMALPEIVYGEPLPQKEEAVPTLLDNVQPGAKREEEEANSSSNLDETHPNSPASTSSQIPESSDMDHRTNDTTNSNNAGVGEGNDDVSIQHEQNQDQNENRQQEQPRPATSSFMDNNPSEMQTTCSICIDDFEPGERLRMLPRCQHIFHTDCILPWLTERQGCCPLCKTDVVKPEDEESDTSDAGNNDNGRGRDGRNSRRSDGERRNHTTLQPLDSPSPAALPNRSQLSEDPEIVLDPAVEGANASEIVRDSDDLSTQYDRIETGQVRTTN